MKKIITAVILVALILAAFSMLSTPRVRADTSEAQILSYSWYVAPLNTVLAEYSGDLVAVGEVENVGSNIISYVVISGVASNSTGIVASVEASAFGVDMPPGQKAPFYLDFAPEDSYTGDQSWVGNVTNVTVAVSFVSDTNQTQYSGLTIPTDSVTSYVDDTGTFTVAGTVQNTGDEATGNVWVVTTFYNASGTVVGLNETNFLDLSGSLASGASVPFTATPTDNTATLSGEIANYSLLVISQPLTTSSPTPSPPPSATPTSSPTASTQPTQSPAPMSSGLIYAGAVAVVVVVVVLVALLFLRKRHKNVQFELPPPPPPPP